MPSVSDSAKATTARRLGAPQTRPHTSYRDSVLSVVALLLAFRILNALTLRTFFQPDEFFQSLEPAWELAFGDTSNAWITWVNASLERLYVHVAGCLSYAANRSGECTCVRPCIRAYLL
jgi:phosphatidylinositol glycan class B